MNEYESSALVYTEVFGEQVADVFAKLLETDALPAWVELWATQAAENDLKPRREEHFCHAELINEQVSLFKSPDGFLAGVSFIGASQSGGGRQHFNFFFWVPKGEMSPKNPLAYDCPSWRIEKMRWFDRP